MADFESVPVVNFVTGHGEILKDEWINNVVEDSKRLNVDERGLVYDYGKNGNLKLLITKDDDLDLRIFVDMWVHPDDSDSGEVIEVDDSEEWFYSESEEDMKKFRKKLERIWNEDYEIDEEDW